MSTLVSFIVVHNHVPHSMNESVIVPIIRDKNNKRVNEKNKFPVSARATSKHPRQFFLIKKKNNNNNN